MSRSRLGVLSLGLALVSFVGCSSDPAVDDGGDLTEDASTSPDATTPHDSGSSTTDAPAAGDTSPVGDAGVPITCATLNYNKPTGTTTVKAPPAPAPKGGTIPENVVLKWTAATQYLEAGGTPGGAKQDAYFFSGGHFIQSPSGSGLGTAIIGDYTTSGTTLTLTPKTLCDYDGGSTPSTNAPQPKTYSIEGTHFLIHTQYSTGLADMRVDDYAP